MTSKGGTTERALATMDAGAVKATIVAAVKAAAERAQRARRRVRQRERAEADGRMFDQALKFLLDTAFGLLTYAFLLRFAMQWLRAPFRNPVGQALIALTDWAVKPVRRVLPGFRGLDWSTLLLAWLAQFLWLLARRPRCSGGGGARRHRRSRRWRCSPWSSSSRRRCGC